MGINDVIKVGSNIKKLRLKSGLTQKNMAELLGIPCSTYSNYENDNREPKKEILLKISNIFQVSMQTLLKVNDDKTEVCIDEAIIPYEITDIQKTELIQKLISLCGYKVTLNKIDKSDYIVNQYLKQQIKNNEIPLLYIYDKEKNINLTDFEFRNLSDKILQIVNFEIQELFKK